MDTKRKHYSKWNKIIQTCRRIQTEFSGFLCKIQEQIMAKQIENEVITRNYKI